MPPHIAPVAALFRRLAALTVLGALLAFPARQAGADELPTAVAGKDTIHAEIEPFAESDEYAVTLFPGDRLTAKTKDQGNTPGLLTTLKLSRPDGSKAPAKIVGNGRRAVTLTYRATVSGPHVLRIVGGEGQSFGAHGGYRLTISVVRGRPFSRVFAGTAAGGIAYRFGATAQATISLTASTKRGGFDLTGLVGPAGAESGFGRAVKAARNRRSARVAAWKVRGGTGEYEVQGVFDKNSAVKIAVTVRNVEKARTRKLGPEPQFRRGGSPVFPDRGISGTRFDPEWWYVRPSTCTPISVTPPTGLAGTMVGVDSEPGTFSYVNARPRTRKGCSDPRPDPIPDPVPTVIPGTYDDPLQDTYPRFFINGIEVPRNTILLQSGPFRFPVVPGLAAEQSYDLVVQNTDGQRAIARDAFTVLPVPSPLGIITLAGASAVEAGPAGGRRLRILGNDLGSVSAVIFDPDGAQPTVVGASVILPTRVDVTAPAHLPGVVSVRLRDEFGQLADVPGTVTYLDVPSNELTTIDKEFLQGIGGETVVVTGSGFAAGSVLTADGAAAGASLDSPTQMTFTSPAHADGTLVLRVADALEQSSTLTVTVKGFKDVTSTNIQSPRTVTNEADGWRATRVITGDVSADGLKDLILLQSAPAIGASKNRSRVRILVANSNGSFYDYTATGFPAVSGDEDWRARDAVLADLDGDSKLDLAILTDDVVSSGARSSLRLLKNEIVNDGSGNLSGGFTDKTSAWAPASTTTYRDGNEDRNQGVAIVAADIDHTGGTDLVIAHTAYFSEDTVTQTDPGDPMADPPIPPTFVTTTKHFPALRVLTNDGSGVLTRTTGVVPAVVDTDVQQFQADTLAAGDVDANGWADVVLSRDLVTESPAGTWHLTARVLKNSGGTLTDASASSLPAASDPEFLQADRLFLVDVNGDTKLDLLLLANNPLVSKSTGGTSSGSALRLFTNSGGQFAATATNTFPAKSGSDQTQADDLAVGDLDGDGALDIVIVSASAPNAGQRACRVLRASGTAWVDASVSMPNPSVNDDGRGDGVLLIDLAADGDLDVVIVRNDPVETAKNTRLLFNQRK